MLVRKNMFEANSGSQEENESSGHKIREIGKSYWGNMLRPSQISWR